MIRMHVMYSAARRYLLIAKKWLMKYRSFLGGAWLEYLGVAALFAILTIIYTNFVLLHPTHQLFVDGPGDATAGFLWLNYADNTLNPFLPVSTLVNYPYGEQLGGPTFITYLALWLPIRLFSFLFGPIAGLNVMMLWGFVSGGVVGYWLLKRLTKSAMVGLFAGLAIAFVPYNLYKSSSHLAYIFGVVFILILASFIALWLRPTRTRAALFAVSIALAFYTDGYYLLLGSVMVFGLCVAGLLHGLVMRYSASDYRRRIGALAISLGALILLMLPVGYVQLTQGGKVQKSLSDSRSKIGDEINAYKSKVMDFILPSPTNPLFRLTGQVDTIDEYKNLRSNRTENMTYIGFVVIALNCIGLGLAVFWAFFRKHSTWGKKAEAGVMNRYLLVSLAVVVCAPLFLSFMLSPSITFHGYVINLPGAFLIEHNIALWRVMSRFFVALHVVLVIHAAFTLWMLVRYSAINTRKLIGTGVIAGAILLTLMEYSTSVNRPSFDYSRVPEAYQWLKSQKDVSVIAELPMVDPLDAHTTRYITYQVVHGKKLVNFKEPSAERLTNALGSTANQESVDFAYERGAQLIVTHNRRCDSVPWGELTHRSKDMPIGEICIYRPSKLSSPDPFFVVYGDGFKYYPNQPKEDTSLASIEKMNATFRVTNESLKQRADGRAKVRAKIHDFHNDKVNGQWILKQGAKVMGTGRIINSSADIEAEIDASQDVVISLVGDRDTLLRPNDLSLNELIVSKL